MHSNAAFFKCIRFCLVPYSFKISVESIPCTVKRLLSFRLYTALHHVVNIKWKGDSDALKRIFLLGTRTHDHTHGRPSPYQLNHRGRLNSWSTT